MKQDTDINCPVCRSNAAFAYDVETKKVQQGLEQIFGSAVPDHIFEHNYSMYKCPECSLEFAWPLIPGSKSFYDFLTQQNGYYSDYRPEYKIVWDYLRTRKGNTKILDVGCGDGSFLKGTLDIPGVKAIGIDTTLESIKKAQSKGIEAYQVPIEKLEMNDFDVVVSFHCLEHVSDPLGFMASIRSKLSNGGVAFISTPYSPLSYEYFWMHPLNHPPHHLLRLNKNAYEELGRRIKMKTEMLNFEKMSLKSHFAGCFSYAIYGKVNYKGIYKKIVLNPLLAMRVFIKVLLRERIDGNLVGNDILVKFYKN